MSWRKYVYFSASRKPAVCTRRSCQMFRGGGASWSHGGARSPWPRKMIDSGSTRRRIVQRIKPTPPSSPQLAWHTQVQKCVCQSIHSIHGGAAYGYSFINFARRLRFDVCWKWRCVCVDGEREWSLPGRTSDPVFLTCCTSGSRCLRFGIVKTSSLNNSSFCLLTLVFTWSERNKSKRVGCCCFLWYFCFFYLFFSFDTDDSILKQYTVWYRHSSNRTRIGSVRSIK